jgi:DNA polymerase
VLCHPLGDRDPKPDEIAACAPYLDAQVAAVTPRVIVTLGLIPLRRLLGADRQVERDHGRIFLLGAASVVPTFHPSALHWRTGRREAAVGDLRTANYLLDDEMTQ